MGKQGGKVWKVRVAPRRKTTNEPLRFTSNNNYFSPINLL